MDGKLRRSALAIDSAEAESAVARDPVFGAALSSAVLDHPDFAHALAHQIGVRLGKTPTDRERFARWPAKLRGLPDLIDAAGRDLQSIAIHDPAMTALLPPLLNFKGYVALQAWRVSNWLWRGRRRDLALLLQSLSSDQLQVSIHPSASIGTSVFLDHATGIIIGAHAMIGDEVTILQNVTIGRKLRSRTAHRKSAEAFISAPVRASSAMSASAISPRLVPARSSSMTYPPAAPRSAFRRG